MAVDCFTVYRLSGGFNFREDEGASVVADLGTQITSPINRRDFVLALLTFNNRLMVTLTLLAIRFHESFDTTV
jgi:hypothetical protein